MRVLRDDLSLPWRNQVRSSTLSFLLLLQSSSPPGRFCSSLLRFSFSRRHLGKRPSCSCCRCWLLFAAKAAGGRSQHQHTHTHTQLPDSPPIETPAQPAHTHTQLTVSPPISMSSSSRYGKHNKRQSHHQSSWVVVIFSCAIRFCCSYSLPKILEVLKHLVVVRGM